MAEKMGMSKERNMSKDMSMSKHGGHLYMQTNEIQNAVIHYHRDDKGALAEVNVRPVSL